MLAKFIRMIEGHSEQIAEQVLAELSKSEQATLICRLPEVELKGHCHQVLDNLGYWLTATDGEEIARLYEERGRVRSREGIPASEAIYFLILLKRKMLDYVREQALAQTTVDYYAEDELRRRVGGFFDSVIYHLVLGYEGAPAPKSARATA